MMTLNNNEKDFQEKLQKEVSLLRRRIDCAMGLALCEVLIRKPRLPMSRTGRLFTMWTLPSMPGVLTISGDT